jgi:hypothetical protein
VVGVFFSLRCRLADFGLCPGVQCSWPVERDLVDETDFRAVPLTGEFREGVWGELKSVDFEEILGRFPSAYQLGVLSCCCPSFFSCCFCLVSHGAPSLSDRPWITSDGQPAQKKLSES